MPLTDEQNDGKNEGVCIQLVLCWSFASQKTDIENEDMSAGGLDHVGNHSSFALQDVEEARKSAEAETARLRKEVEAAAERSAAEQKDSVARIQAERDAAKKREQEAVQKLQAERDAAEKRAQEINAKLQAQQDAASKQLKQLQVSDFDCSSN